MMRPIRILHLITNLEGGGAERQLINYLLNTDDPAIEHAVHTWNPSELEPVLRERRIAVYHCGGKRRTAMATLWSTARTIQQWKPDVIQTWIPHTDVIGGLLGRMLRVPMIASEYSSRDLYLREDLCARRWFTRMRPAVLSRCAAAAVTNSRGGARYLQEDLRLNIPVHLIPNGLKLELIRDAQPADLRAIGVPDGVPVLVTVSRIEPLKRIDLILRAMTLTPVSIASHLVVCGSGSHLEFLRNLTGQLGLNERVHFMGFQKNPVAVIKACDLFCTASEVEGMPNAVLEALVSGRPIVGSDIDAHRDLLDGTGAAALFSSGCEKGLAECLSRIWSTPSRLKTMAEAAYQAGLNYSIEQTVGRFNWIYKNFPRRRPR